MKLFKNAEDNTWGPGSPGFPDLRVNSSLGFETSNINEFGCRSENIFLLNVMFVFEENL